MFWPRAFPPALTLTTLLGAGVGCAPASTAPPVVFAGEGEGDVVGEGEGDGEVPLPANPVLDDDFPDPFVLVVDGAYYAFATNGPGVNVRVSTSTDLATWSPIEDALPVLPSWAQADSFLTWAPSVLDVGEGVVGARFVLYFTARDIASGFQCIGRATSSSPAGPYVDASGGGPMICQTDLCGSIDASPFRDPRDGSAWVVWKSDENAPQCGRDSRLWSAPLSADGESLAFFGAELLARDQDWEAPLIEGPAMLPLDDGDGRMLLFYSANWWESASYAIGVAVCDSPAGPCTKQSVDGPWAASADGAGGEEFFHDSAGRLLMAYHGWSHGIGYGAGGARTLRIDEVAVDGAGAAHVVLTAPE